MPFATPNQQRQLKFETLPEWIQKEYHTNGTIYHVVTRWLYTPAMSKEECLSKIAEIEHARAEHYFKVAIEVCSLHGMPPVVISDKL